MFNWHQQNNMYMYPGLQSIIANWAFDLVVAILMMQERTADMQRYFWKAFLIITSRRV